MTALSVFPRHRGSASGLDLSGIPQLPRRPLAAETKRVLTEAAMSETMREALILTRASIDAEAASGRLGHDLGSRAAYVVATARPDGWSRHFYGLAVIESPSGALTELRSDQWPTSKRLPSPWTPAWDLLAHALGSVRARELIVDAQWDVENDAFTLRINGDLKDTYVMAEERVPFGYLDDVAERHL